MKQKHTRGSALGALIVILGGVLTNLTDGDPTTMPDWNAVAASVLLCYNAWWSRQTNVSSEEVGAKEREGGP